MPHHDLDISSNMQEFMDAMLLENDIDSTVLEEHYYIKNRLKKKC